MTEHVGCKRLDDAVRGDGALLHDDFAPRLEHVRDLAAQDMPQRGLKVDVRLGHHARVGVQHIDPLEPAKETREVRGKPGWHACGGPFE